MHKLGHGAEYISTQIRMALGGWCDVALFLRRGQLEIIKIPFHFITVSAKHRPYNLYFSLVKPGKTARF